MEHIPLRPLGKSGCMISPVGLGTWQFGERQNFLAKMWPKLEEPLIDRIVQASLVHGINWFDTAEAYGKGASEREVARALLANGKKPGDVLLATKWFPVGRTASNIPKTIGERISALTPFPVDLYQVHHPMAFSGVRKVVEAMARLIGEGKIKYVGVSNYSAAQMRNAWEVLDRKGIPLVSNQVRYSILDRRIESNGVLKTARELGITIIAYSPLAQGLATGKFHDHPEVVKTIGMRRYTPPFRKSEMEKSRPVVEAVRQMARKYGVTPSQVALNWLIHAHDSMVVAIPGATSEEQARENAGTMSFRLSEEDLRLLDRTGIR